MKILGLEFGRGRVETRFPWIVLKCTTQTSKSQNKQECLWSLLLLAWSDTMLELLFAIAAYPEIILWYYVYILD